MIDTHCHLTFPDFAGRIGDVLQSAREQGVSGCITISTTTLDCMDGLAIAHQHDNVWCTAGVHPLYSDQHPHEWGNVRSVALDPRCVAFGELGLDNHYDTPAASEQREVLAQQLEHLRSWRADDARLDKPVVIHCRKAFDDLIPVLRMCGIAPGRFVFHCFTGNVEDARKVLDFGALLSFTGVVTYRNAREVADAARFAPLERIMVETDAPYLSPEPVRGVRPCEPWMTSLTARFIAQLKGVEFDVFHARINATTSAFFGIDAR